MTPSAQRIAIAEACGWKIAELDRKHGPLFGMKNDVFGLVPDFTRDLNAMHEAEKLVTTNESSIPYLENLARISCPWHATAQQKAEALLKALDLWVEDTT